MELTRTNRSVAYPQVQLRESEDEISPVLMKRNCSVERCALLLFSFEGMKKKMLRHLFLEESARKAFRIDCINALIAQW